MRTVRMGQAGALLGLVALAGGLGAALQQNFEIETTFLPLPVVGQPYRVRLQAAGGTPPYHWRLLRPLPAGLAMDAGGWITGVAVQGGPPLPEVLVEVADSAHPPLVETRVLPFSEGGPLAVDWNPAPAAAAGELTGGVRVANHSRQRITLTVIVVAVNEIGKAFALRYDHEELGTEAATRALRFAVAMPPGDYVVRVDAVAEVAKTGAIYRDRLQTGRLAVPGGR
ncbi:MAG TPA: hypothetical protein VMV31_08000 [Terriglobales bacterium]|nr:hypothetical protein [Terriglobales bacterium]